jgi:ATP-binding cassette subfamily F protein uup
MDEPTNDLDMETLELLEELLLDYAGTLLLISHDRAFLNNVVTSTFVLEGGGAVNEYPGGYDDWLSQRKSVVAISDPKSNTDEAGPLTREVSGLIRAKPKSRRLSYKEEQEIIALTAKIEKLETEQDQLLTGMSDPSFFKKSPREISQAKEKLEVIEDKLLMIYQRWEALEDLRGGF